MYLSYGTRLDIIFAVGQQGKHNVDSQVWNIKATKKVVRYLKDQMHLGLIYRSYLKDKSNTLASTAPFSFSLIDYENNSYARDFEDGKSVMEYCYFINGEIVS